MEIIKIGERVLSLYKVTGANYKISKKLADFLCEEGFISSFTDDTYCDVYDKTAFSKALKSLDKNGCALSDTDLEDLAFLNVAINNTSIDFIQLHKEM